MAEVLAEFPELIGGPGGDVYRAHAVGAMTPEARWEGWIEFIPVAGGTPLRTPRETTQPNRTDIVYWATGLTAVYLEGAFKRALTPQVRHVPVPSAPVFDEPAPRAVQTADVPVRDAVIDPFEVYAHGEEALRRKLQAFEAVHLANIIIAYRLSAEPVAVLETLSRSSLAEIIVGGVRNSR
jgi:hypothetical protein